jgi:hypothetical protein
MFAEATFCYQKWGTISHKFDVSRVNRAEQDMTATISLIENGYQVIPLVGHHNIFRAYNSLTGDDFLFSSRGKASPSYRRVTHTWELGVDVPDYNSYITATAFTKIKDFVVFFDIENPHSTRWILATDIKIKGRHWQDRDNFPNGIYFVPVESTKDWKTCGIFTIKERAHGLP